MKTKSLLLIVVFCLLAQSPTLFSENPYDTALGITRFDIQLTPDFQANQVDLTVKFTARNFSQETLERNNFLLGKSGNHDDWDITVSSVRLIENNAGKGLDFFVKRMPNPYGGEDEWPVYEVVFDRPLPPGGEMEIQFEYTIKGKSPNSGFPLARAEEKELYLISDFVWLPMVFFTLKAGSFPNLYMPEWHLIVTCPSELTVVVDGEWVDSQEHQGFRIEEWKSVTEGLPQILVGSYQTIRQKKGTFTAEMYTPREPELIQAAKFLTSDLVRIFHIFSGLYGDPGSATYRLITSHTDWGGHGLFMGQVLQKSYLRSLSLETLAHELAHTWWGSRVVSYGEGSKFLREAMAQFSAFWALKQIKGDDFFRNSLLDIKSGFFVGYLTQEREPRLFPLIEQEGFPQQAIIYANYWKGPLVVNQLRLELGDDLFFRGLRTFTTKYARKNVTMADFVQTFNDVSGQNLTPLFKELCWNPGYPSYRVINFQSDKQGKQFVTTVKIENEGDVGARCPLLLRMDDDQKEESFRVEGQSQKEFRFFTDKEVRAILTDPEMTAFHYNPEDRVRLFLAIAPSYMEAVPLDNWLWFNCSYAQYLDDRPQEAYETISRFLQNAMNDRKVKDLDELLAGDHICVFAGYLLKRAVYRLEFGDGEGAQGDARKVVRSLFRAMKERSEDISQIFHLAGIVPEPKLESLIALLNGLIGKDFILDPGLDDEARKQKIEEWRQWWENEGFNQPLHLEVLIKR